MPQHTPAKKAAKKVAKKARKGMGFEAAARAVAARQGISMKQARAIVAERTREASPAAKKANPNLAKVTSKRQRAAKKTASQRQGRTS